MGHLGSRLLDGRGVSRDVEQGEQWLRKAAEAGDPSARLRLGYLVYGRSLGLAEPLEAHREAGGHFLGAWREDKAAGVNLAYMLRRGEFEAKGLDVASLLGDSVEEGDPVALVNLALHLIRGASSREAWSQADELLARAVASEGISQVDEWWNMTAEYGDPEGPLVAALLWRHGHREAGSEQVAVWWRIAEAAGWVIPPEVRGRFRAEE